MPANKLPKMEYTAIDGDSDHGELDGFLERGFSSEYTPRLPLTKWHRVRRWLHVVIPWFLTVFFATFSMVLLWRQDPSHLYKYGTYETEFDTDLATVGKIPLEQIRFGGSPHFLKNGTGFMDEPDPNAPWPENMRLFGKPSPEVDANWERLIGNRYFSISEEEAVRAWGDRRHEYVDERLGGYSAGLDVFHTLHCVNAIRRMLHKSYYHDTHPHGPFHADHCLDAIRQSLQCYGSTTLIPTKYREGLHRVYIDSNQVHTCRSFQYLRDFATSRARGHENFAERDKSLVDEHRHRLAVEWNAKHHPKGKGDGGL